MVAVKVAAFYRFRPAAARNASAWATRGPSVGEPLVETGAAAPAARNGPLLMWWSMAAHREAAGAAEAALNCGCVHWGFICIRIMRRRVGSGGSARSGGRT